MVVLLCLALSGALVASQPGPARSSDRLEAVRAALVRRSDVERATEPELVARLTGLGPPVAPELFALVSGERIEELFSVPDGVPEPVFLCPPDRIGALALEALAELPPAPVIEHLRTREAARPERGVRVAEVRVLGALGSAQGLGLLLELAQAFEDELVSRPVRDPLRESLVSILRSDPPAFGALEDRVPELGTEILHVVAEALEATGQAEGAELLEELLGRDPVLDRTALGALAGLESRYPWRLHLDVRAQVRPRLESHDPETRAVAAKALGQLRDDESLAALIACLGDEDLSVARVAHWALGEISGNSSCRGASEWNAWLEAELAWWKTEGARWREQLSAGDGTRMVEALRALEPHPFGRELLAEDLVALLPSLGPELQVLVTGTLARLGQRSVVPSLLDLLFQGDARVRRAAWEALRKLTGEELPLEPRLWEEYAFG